MAPWLWALLALNAGGFAAGWWLLKASKRRLERSDRLARLKSTICRPLDKPRPEKPLVELRAFDEAIESIEVVDDSFGDQSGEQT